MSYPPLSKLAREFAQDHSRHLQPRYNDLAFGYQSGVIPLSTVLLRRFPRRGHECHGIIIRETRLCGPEPHGPSAISGASYGQTAARIWKSRPAVRASHLDRAARLRYVHSRNYDLDHPQRSFRGQRGVFPPSSGWRALRPHRRRPHCCIGDRCGRPQRGGAASGRSLRRADQHRAGLQRAARPVGRGLGASHYLISVRPGSQSFVRWRAVLAKWHEPMRPAIGFNPRLAKKSCEAPMALLSLGYVDKGTHGMPSRHRRFPVACSRPSRLGSRPVWPDLRPVDLHSSPSFPKWGLGMPVVRGNSVSRLGAGVISKHSGYRVLIRQTNELYNNSRTFRTIAG
jgi:hypothetical protein